jgi:hypothetical protein
MYLKIYELFKVYQNFQMNKKYKKCKQNRTLNIMQPNIINKIKEIEKNYNFGVIIDESQKNLWIKIFDSFMYNTCVIDTQKKYIDKTNIRFVDKYDENNIYRVVLLGQQNIEQIQSYGVKHIWMVLNELPDNMIFDTKYMISLKKPSADILINAFDNHNYNYNNIDMIQSANKLIDMSHDNKNIECVICKDEAINTIKTECGHYFCYGCIMQNFKFNNACPLCRKIINIKSLFYTEIINKNKYEYINSLIIKYGQNEKILFCSAHAKYFMGHFLNKNNDVKTYDIWNKNSTGCTFINPININSCVIINANKVILLDDKITNNIFELMKITNHVTWYLNVRS